MARAPGPFPRAYHAESVDRIRHAGLGYMCQANATRPFTPNLQLTYRPRGANHAGPPIWLTTSPWRKARWAAHLAHHRSVAQSPVNWLLS